VRNRALLVVAKRPTPGQTKTRLCPPLTGRQAADLYNCLLLDTLELVRSVGDVYPIIAYLPQDAAGHFEALAPDFGLLPQKGADLGERLDNALTHCLQNGFRQVVIMNSDGPTLPVANLRRAFEILDEGVDVVLGPCEDGGYYLIGITTPQPSLFRGIQMSTPRVMDETLARAHQAGLSVVALPTWYDVDTAADLTRLAVELKEAADGVGSHTQSFLTAHPELMDY
jgi:rSAM/selenodomain-associated transferase 1